MTIIDARENTNDPRATTSPYERHVLDQHESSSQSITTAMSSGKRYRKRSVSPGSKYSEDEDEEKHETMPVEYEDEAATFTESNNEQYYEDYDLNHVTESEEDGKAAEYYESEEKNDAEEKGDLSEKIEKEQKEEEQKETEEEEEMEKEKETKEEEGKETEEEESKEAEEEKDEEEEYYGKNII